MANRRTFEEVEKAAAERAVREQNKATVATLDIIIDIATKLKEQIAGTPEVKLTGVQEKVEFPERKYTASFPNGILESTSGVDPELTKEPENDELCEILAIAFVLVLFWIAIFTYPQNEPAACGIAFFAVLVVVVLAIKCDFVD